MIVNSKSDIVMFMYNSFGFEGMIKEMIEKGIENPEGDIDTSGLDEYITVAKSSKKAKKAIDNIEK